MSRRLLEWLKFIRVHILWLYVFSFSISELPSVVPKPEEPQTECDDLSKQLIKLLR